MVRGLRWSVALLLVLGVLGAAVIEEPRAERPLTVTRGAHVDLPDLPVPTSLLDAVTSIVPTLTKPTLPVTVPTVPPLRGNVDDVFYVSPEGDEKTLREINYLGVTVRSIRVEAGVDCCGMQHSSPDGSYFTLGSDIYDKAGRPHGNIQGVWADDNAHVCRVSYVRTGQAPSDQHKLELVAVDGEARLVTVLPPSDEPFPPRVIACSPKRNKVVVTFNNPEQRKVIQVRLSDGAVSPVPVACRWGYAMSADGRYLISGDDGKHTLGPATICDLDTGQVEGHSPYMGRLNGDGSALATSVMDDCGWYHNNIVYDWRTGAIVWSANDSPFKRDCQHTWITDRTHAGGDEFVMQSVIVNAGKDPGDVVIVRPGHPAQKVATDIAYARVF